MILNHNLAENASAMVGPIAQARTNAMAGETFAGVDMPPELVALVDQHWLSFPPATPDDHLILGVVYAFIFAAGTVGNGVVLYTFLTTKNLRTTSNMFIANLAVFDLIMMSQLPLFVGNSLYQGQVFGKVGCTLFGLLGALAGMGAAMNNVAIAYDRYRSIAFPMDGRISISKALIFILFVWLWATPFSLMPTLEIWNRFIPEGYLTTCSFDYLTPGQDSKMFMLAIFAWAYVIPVCLLVLFYSKILGHVREHEKAMKQQATKMGVKSLSAGDEEKSAEVKIAKVAVTIFFLFLCAWTPYAVVCLVGVFGKNRAVLTPFASMVPAVFSKTIACVDPWVYAISHPKIREAVHHNFPWLVSEDPAIAAKKKRSAGGDAVSQVTVDSKPE